MSEEILTAIYGVFEPFRPPIREAYVDCQEVRGRWNVLRQLGREITRSGNQPTCQLFTGYRGVGKSTELLRLQEELEKQKFFVVYFAADQDDIEPQDTEFADILFACTRHLLQKIKLEGNANPLQVWATSRWEELKSLAQFEIRIEDLSLETPENPFAKIATTIRAVPDKRRQLRDKLNADTPSLIVALNAFIQEAKKKLAKEGYQDIVIIADNLDRIVEKELESGRPTNYDEIYLNRSEPMRSLNCHVIYTVPISLVYSSRATRLEDTYGKPDVLPMIMVRNPDHSVNQPGLDKLREIIRQRIQVVDRKMQSQYADSLDTSVFASAEVLDLLCLMSGGHVRNLMQLIRTAIDWIDELPITMQAAQISIEETRDTYRDTIEDEQWEILAEACHHKRVENNDPYRRLFLSRCLLEYRYWDEAGALKRWCDVHPLVEGLEQFDAALNKFRASL